MEIPTPQNRREAISGFGKMQEQIPVKFYRRAMMR
jgi:hypothetical protein